MDLLETIQDITRAYHEQHGLPSPDGNPASDDARDRLAEAKPPSRAGSDGPMFRYSA